MGSGTLSANGGMSMNATNSSSGELQISQATLNLAAGNTATFAGTGNIDIGLGGALVNSGTFVAQNNQYIDDNIGDGGTFNNKGVFIRNTGAGAFTVLNGITFDNSGSVIVRSGTLDLQGQDNGNTTGSYVVGPGTLQFDGNYTLKAASTISGSGNVDFASGTIAISDNSTLAGTTIFGGATVGASGNPVFSGPISLTGGILAGSGTFSANGGISLNATNSGNGEVQLSQATLVNAMGKVATFAGTGNIDIGFGGKLVNNGTFVAQNNQVIDDNVSNGGTIVNNGLFIRNTATGTFDLAGGITLNNTGTVNVQTGTLEIDGAITQLSGSTLTGGTWVVSNGATLFFNNNGSPITTNNGDVTLGGPGAVFAAINSIADNTDAFRVLGNRNFAAAGNFTNGGTLQLGGGIFTATSLIGASGGQILGYGTINAPVQLNATAPVSVGTGGTGLTMEKAISGTGGLITSGPGTLILQGADSYSGGTTVTSGTVQLGNTLALGAAPGRLAVNAGTVDLHGFSPMIGALSGISGGSITTLSSGTATLKVNGTASTLYGGKLTAGSGALTLIKSGGGTLTLTGNSALGGNLVSGSLGAIQISGGGVVSDSTGIAGYGGGAVTVTGAGSKWANTSALDIGDLGSGALTITAGGSVSSAGSSYLGFDSGSKGVATVSGSGSKWTTAATLYAGNLGSGTLTVAAGGLVSDGNGLLAEQPGTSAAVVVSGSGSRWTNTNIAEIGVSGTGTLSIGAGGAVTDVYGYIGFNAGSSGGVAVSGTGSAWTNTGTLTLGYLGTGALTITGGGAVNVTGATTINKAGTLQVDGASMFNTGSLTVNGGTVRTLGALAFAHSVTLAAGGMNVDSHGFNSTFSGVFGGAGGLTKSGAGTLSITGASAYTGATTVSAGTLALKTASLSTASLGNTAITVASGAVLSPTLGASPFSRMVNVGTTGTGSAGAKLTLSPGSALSMVDGAIGTFNIQEGNSFAGAGLVIGGASGVAPALSFDIGNAAAGTDLIHVTKTVSVLATGGTIAIDALAGDTSLTPGSYDLITAAGGFSGTGGNGFSLSSNTISLDGSTYSLTLANSTTTTEILSVSLDSTPAVPELTTASPSDSSGLSRLDARELLYGRGAAGAESVTTAATPGISSARELARPAIGTAAVPEPEDWASGIGALFAMVLLARRRRGGKSSWNRTCRR
jgi:T5SS/PEP-CTERM-associated repeat protein/autotransporter-associated beta strand protein